MPNFFNKPCSLATLGLLSGGWSWLLLNVARVLRVVIAALASMGL